MVSRPGEVTQPIQCALQTLEGLYSTPGTQIKNLGMVAHTFNPRARKVGRGQEDP